MALKSLKKSLELAVESKQGMTHLEKFCLELDEEDRRKKEQAQKKRDKKSKQKQNKNNKKEKENSRYLNGQQCIFLVVFSWRKVSCNLWKLRYQQMYLPDYWYVGKYFDFRE